MSTVNKKLCQNPSQTKELAGQIAKKILAKPPSSKAVVLALSGDLGTGKTTFVQGFAKGLGITRPVTSPSFIIMNKFQISKSKFQTNSKIQVSKIRQPFQTFYHFDCWRLAKPGEILELGFEKIIADPKNIVAIEWAEKIKDILPDNTMFLRFVFKNNNSREIFISERT